MMFADLPRCVGRFTWTDDIRAFPQFYRCSPRFALPRANPDLRAAIEYVLASALTRHWKHISIDTRISMLMPGMYPCIPGWHCDDFWRPTGQQPDLGSAPDMEHVAVVFGATSFTRYVKEPIELGLPTAEALDGQPLYRVMHEAIETLRPQTFQVRDGEAWRFTQRSWHRGESATERGWRCFFRLTGSDHLEPVNEVRTQSQVYLTEPFSGW